MVAEVEAEKKPEEWDADEKLQKMENPDNLCDSLCHAFYPGFPAQIFETMGNKFSKIQLNILYTMNQINCNQNIPIFIDFLKK